MFVVRFFIVFFLFGIALSGNANADQIREYWISAENTVWDYAPTGKNLIRPEQGLGIWGATTRYNKYRYFAYTDGTYTNRIEQPEWTGILGPQLIGEVGDTLKVHFKNMSYTYTWILDEKAGPGPADPSSIVWVYHSHVKPVEEVYAGLIGSIVVTAKGMAISPEDPRPKDVDHSFTTMFMVFDEENGEEGGLMHAMNGYIFGNLQNMEVDQGDLIRWHLIGMGSEIDLHTAHWHGETVLNGGRRTDVINLMPATMTSVTMSADNPGTWLYHCHVTDHISAGMITRWQVNKAVK
jgi:hypothetical protein